ncbi:RNA-directed DNA polymerase, eukaryota, Reverse transcriptase zinc-binding domain protein [Artemisia annua]|uniref:RNA-directed DNA polymerase, eukaryota, Reverse transcriptase zinc-binding domain protein n=1 Tax=Artemisia annua TaxID=35608 RepID=A0A2U1NZQ4_ARTAN|nr:RNA-directed DNA polymerase, eukaryota, Reverse transcriptase zinc-binding domain protein [Artemisia annua]
MAISRENVINVKAKAIPCALQTRVRVLNDSVDEVYVGFVTNFVKPHCILEESHNGKDDQETNENREELISDKESVKENHSNSHSFRDESLARTKSIQEGFSMLDKFNDNKLKALKNRLKVSSKTKREERVQQKRECTIKLEEIDKRLDQGQGFKNDPHALWVRVVKSIHGVDGLLSSSANRPRYLSVWTQIIKATNDLKEKGLDLSSFCIRKLGNGCNTSFWNDLWLGDHPLKMCFPRVFALELNKNISVAHKKEQGTTVISFRRAPRSGIEATQWEEIKQIIDSVCLSSMEDRWIWSMNGSGFARWWETQIPDISTFDQWMDWFSNLRLNSKQKDYLQATFFSLWWHVWAFRNACIFGSSRPRQNLFFDKFVTMSFSWVNSRVVEEFPRLISGHPLKMCFPRVFALELNKNISVAHKKEQGTTVISFRRAPRSGIEATQWEEIKQIIDSVCLSSMEDRWIWSVNGSGYFL